MIDNQQLPWTFTLLPGSQKRINYTGSYFALQLNDTTVDPIVSFDSGVAFPVKAGTGFPTVQFNADKSSTIPAIFHYVEITNPSNTETMTLTVLVCLGGLDDTRSIISGYIQIDLSAPGMQVPAALAVAAPADPEDIQPEEYSVLPANALAKERIVQNNGDYPIWWGDENISPFSKRGIVINPGGSAVINCWGAVYFIAEDAASTLSVVNILKQI